MSESGILAMVSFDDLLEGKALAAAKEYYKKPTAIQKECIPIVLAGHDLIAMSKTGSGKTAAFLLPLIQLLNEHATVVGARALIVAPTRELCVQTTKFFHDYAKRTGLKVAALIGGDPLPPQFDALAKNPDLIVATPGRLLHIIAETGYSLSKVNQFIIDEADQLFEKGFETQLSAILQMLPKKRQNLLFSATIPQVLAEFTRINLANALTVKIEQSQLPNTLTMRFPFIAPTFKPALLLQVIAECYSALVFVATRHHAEYLSALFEEMGVNCACVYGAMDQEERNIALNALRKGEIKALFVTDVAARGIDIPALEMVVNYDFPERAKIFLHRAGRAGRAGRKGTVISFVTAEELPYYVGARNALQKEEKWEVVRVSRSEIEEQLMLVDDAQRRNYELDKLKVGMQNGEQMYVKSRQKAKPQWLTEAKLVEIVGGSSSTEEALLKWRPKETIFEQAAVSDKQSDIMRKIRAAHRGHTKSNAPINVPTNANVKVSSRVAPPKTEVPKSKFFVNYQEEGTDSMSTRRGTTSSVRDMVLNMTPDDLSGLRVSKKATSKKEMQKKERMISHIQTNNESLVKSAVSQLEGVKAKGDKYKKWAEKSHKSIQKVGDEERIIRGTGKRKGRNEVKSAREFEKSYLIKMKHKLHNQKKHKEASALNARIYRK